MLKREEKKKIELVCETSTRHVNISFHVLVTKELLVSSFLFFFVGTFSFTVSFSTNKKSWHVVCKLVQLTTVQPHYWHIVFIYQQRKTRTITLLLHETRNSSPLSMTTVNSSFFFFLVTKTLLTKSGLPFTLTTDDAFTLIRPLHHKQHMYSSLQTRSQHKTQICIWLRPHHPKLLIILTTDL